MNSTMTFEIALDGTLQNIRGDIEGFTPDQQLIHRLLFAAQKSLIDEEVVSMTVASGDYILKIAASGAIFTGIVSKNTPKLI